MPHPIGREARLGGEVGRVHNAQGVVRGGRGLEAREASVWVELGMCKACGGRNPTVRQSLWRIEFWAASHDAVLVSVFNEPHHALMR